MLVKVFNYILFQSILTKYVLCMFYVPISIFMKWVHAQSEINYNFIIISTRQKMNAMPMGTRTVSNVDMYADDSTTSACGKNIQEIELKLNNDLQGISNWCDENRMVVNTEKTKVMVVTIWQKWQHLDKTNVNICIKGDKLQVVESEWLHGLQADNFLT